MTPEEKAEKWVKEYATHAKPLLEQLFDYANHCDCSKYQMSNVMVVPAGNGKAKYVYSCSNCGKKHELIIKEGEEV